MLDRLPLWVLRAVWATLPLTAGPLIAGGLDASDDGFASVATVVVWTVWALTLVATLVAHSITLTIVRIVAPAAVVAALAALVGEGSIPAEILGLVTTSVAAVTALAAPVGAFFVNGTSYGDERRLPLRPPMVLLLGPVQVAWLIAVAGSTVGPAMLSVRWWVAGAIVTAVGVPMALIATRALHGLARRWVVFVPAGVVLHDSSVLVDPQLFRRADMVRIGPALADTDALDLTQGAVGLALELRLVGPTKIARREGRTPPPPVEAGGLLFTPTQPGVVLNEAHRRRLPVG